MSHYPVTCEQFADYCKERKIWVLPDILRRHIEGDYYGTHINTAIIAAAYILRKRPGIRLGSCAIDFPSGDDIPSRQFCGIIGNTIKRTKKSPNFDMGMVRSVEACINAEAYFADEITELRRKGAYADYGPVIFMHGKKPLALRKTRGLMSSLTLLPLTINGIYFPPMSLMRIETKEDSIASNGELINSNFDSLPSLCKANDIARIAFIRPTAFGLPVEQRRAYYPDELPDSRCYTAEQITSIVALVAKEIASIKK